MISEFYVQFVPDISSYTGNVTAIRPARLTSSKPHTPLPGAYVVKMQVDLPEAVFLPAETPVVQVTIDGTKTAIVSIAQDLAAGR